MFIFIKKYNNALLKGIINKKKNKSDFSVIYQNRAAIIYLTHTFLLY